MKRFVRYTDRFEIICKKCGSKNVDMQSEDCHECGITHTFECNDCKQSYDYHRFEMMEDDKK
jgi:hypothetical protein